MINFGENIYHKRNTKKIMYAQYITFWVNDIISNTFYIKNNHYMHTGVFDKVPNIQSHMVVERII